MHNTCRFHFFAFTILIFSVCAQESTPVEGTGASFPSDVYRAWASAFASENVFTVSYIPTSSGSGKEAIKSGEYTFVGSDSLLEQADYDLVPDLQVKKTRRLTLKVKLTIINRCYHS